MVRLWPPKRCRWGKVDPMKPDAVGWPVANFATALTRARAVRDSLIRRTGLAAGLGFVRDDRVLPAI